MVQAFAQQAEFRPDQCRSGRCIPRRTLEHHCGQETHQMTVQNAVVRMVKRWAVLSLTSVNLRHSHVCAECE